MGIGGVGSLTYAGRLDPLASGLIIALEGKEIAQKEEMLALPKSYDMEVLFGFATDTFDLLGMVEPASEFAQWKTLFPQYEGAEPMVQKAGMSKIRDLINLIDASTEANIDTCIDELNLELAQLVGDIELAYPFYSSKPIDGMPLFSFVRKFGLGEANKRLPTKQTELHKVVCVSAKRLTSAEIMQKVDEVCVAMKDKGDFRQEEIRKKWQDEIARRDASGCAPQTTQDNYLVLRFSISCGSGFYMRSFAMWIGQIVGSGALAYSILRTSIGLYLLTDHDVIV